MSEKSDVIRTCVGRLISGSLTETVKKDFDGNPVPENEQQYRFGVAFRKDDPGVGAMLQAVQAHAMKEFANNQQALQLIQNFQLEGFSWKIADGDKPNREGVMNPNSQGCWVFYFSAPWVVATYDQNNAQMDAKLLKRGYFVDMGFDCQGNGLTGSRAGMYLNPRIIRMVAFGEEITGGINAEEFFGQGGAPTQLPPGASATPVSAGNLPGQSTQPGQQNTAQGLPGVGTTAQQNTTAMTGSLGNTGLPQQTAAPVAGLPQQTAAPVAGFATGQLPQ